MENTSYSYDLYHHGTKGMRWGVRRFQNSDGSLTPAGRKRYSKDDGMTNWQRKRYEKQAAKLKKETAKVKEAEEKAAAKKKAQSKFTKLEEKQKALEARKKALKDGKDPEEEKKKEGESLEDRKARLMSSSNAKELYENRHLLSTNELNDRINRIDAEVKLQSRIVEEKQKTGMDFVDGLKNKIDHGVALYKSVDSAYSTVTNSAIGKTLAKKLGLEPPEKEFNLGDLWSKRNKLSDKQIQDIKNRVENEKQIELEIDRRVHKSKKQAEEAKKAIEESKAARKAAREEAKAAKKAREDEEKAVKLADAQRQVDEYIKKMYPEPDQTPSTTYSMRGEDIIDSRTETRRNNPTVLLLEDKSMTRASAVPQRVEDGRSYADKFKSIYGDARVK